MKQLKMRWNNDFLPMQAPTLPEGLELKTFPQVGNAIEAWLDIVQYDLTTKRENEAFYHIAMTGYKGYEERNCFFVLKDGEPVATFAILPNHTDVEGEGYVHCVGSKPSCRGMGIGNYMSLLSVYVLKQEGMKTAFLTTDDWRIPAIKTYLKAGFEPEIIDDDAKVRWDAVLQKCK